ncbi:homeobox transcription factor, putative [Cordyceps militaris CM01]|uniref:Homeobox transcription factor, putative n=1 Tax=Cordyceps militaris (strain CM01) TaxID=983644 RepID=G3JQ01_CORMM|nr:homeobox transcription factor, putative [Cordyceps militaris CM01]EGX89252.1 homeobox transcription factor, putative [Cordyceps militaris CM01]
MAMIAVPPPPSSAFPRDRWDARPSDYSLPRDDSRSVALPSIRQAIPELQLATNPERQSRPNSHHTPPGWTNPGYPGSSDYIHSPSSKRRRISHELESESLRSYQVPRLYPSPERPVSSHVSPISQRPPTADDIWRSQAPAHYRPSMSASPEFAHREHRPSIHTLPPPPGLERGREAQYAEDYASRQRLEAHSAGLPHRSPVFASRHGDRGNRYHAAPTPSTRGEERSPFAPSRYSMHDGGRYNDVGMMAIGGDTKQRKRRGNLPKETTDKLRSWFVAHLQHPYPTEDEKQDLMRQTGLQMNQISNWFINARRRQLPAMISNARAETDAMHGRGGVDVASISSPDGDAAGLDRESTYDASPRMRGVGGLKRD